MTRSSTRRSGPRARAWLWSAAALAPALVLTACSGKVSIGHNGTTMQALSPAAVSGTASACPSGSAHPNVCCTATPGKQTSCGNYPDAPFQACDTGYQTYPDPRSCCTLGGSNACTPANTGSPDTPIGSPNSGAPSSDGGPASNPGGPATNPGGGSSCVYPCPVGWYPSPNGSPGECCTSTGNGVPTCTAVAAAGNCSACACPPCAPGATCPTCTCPPATPCPSTPPATPQCDPCPPGWQPPAGEPGLCCQQEANGAIACFSQAVPPPSAGGPTPSSPPSSTPPSPGYACSGGGPTGPDGGVGGCTCNDMLNGHAYQLDCPNGGGACTCSIDGNPSKQVSPGSAGCTSQASNTLLAQCGFPTH